ncbi:hypothetical protein EP7_002990 [Isosphaeraceae bacterium EP7]
MPTNRTILTLAFVGLWPVLVQAQATPADPAQTPAPAAAVEPGSAAIVAPPTEAEALIDAAILKIVGLKSVSADIRQSVQMLGQKFMLNGKYLKDVDNRLYMKLSVSGLGNSTGTLLQVCDGKTLWDFRQVLESQSYSKLDIIPIFQKLNTPGVDPKLRDQIIGSLGFTGPDTLLSGLRKVVRFDQKEEATLDGKPVYIFRGTWISRDGLTTANGQPLPPSIPLPAYIPSIVTVWVGKEDGWPYQLELIGQVPSVLASPADNSPRDQNGRVIGKQAKPLKVTPSKIELVYSNVKFNPELPPDNFAFQALPGTPVADSTQELVGRLDEMIRAQAEQAKQEAAKGAPLLNEGLELPKTTEGAAGFPLAKPFSPAPATPAAPR